MFRGHKTYGSPLDSCAMKELLFYCSNLISNLALILQMVDNIF